MFFEELVQQHRVYRFVAHGVNFSIGIASDEVRVHLCDFLGYQTELRDILRINLGFVAERHWSQRKDRFAGFVHRLDLVFETRRRGNGSKLSGGVYKSW